MLVNNFNPRRHEAQNYFIQIYYERKEVHIYDAPRVLNNESYLCYQIVSISLFYVINA